MAFRHAAMVFLIILFCFCSAASSQLWAQWLVAVIFVGVMLLVDLIFLDDSARAPRPKARPPLFSRARARRRDFSPRLVTRAPSQSFIFDPDPDNWRRRVERSE
jgi:hypothetical protein